MGKVIVTGGAGFIGTHLCTRLLSEGHEVICLDNFISGSRDNLANLMDNPNFKLIEFDLCSPLEELFQLDKLEGLSAIFHFACPASPNPESSISYLAHPLETLMVSSLGSQHMLDLAVAKNCQIILASTSEVYGDPLVHPQSEEYWGNVNPIGVRSCYDEGKRFMEALAFTYLRQSQAKIKIVRIFNTYGPLMRLDDGRFTINLIDSYLNHKPFKMYGDGEVTRSFCYIDDLVEGVMRVFGEDRILGKVINLGNPGEYTINDAIAVFETIIGSKLPKEVQPGQPDDPRRRCPDIKLAKELLGWEPQIDFKTGIAKTLTHYQSKLT